MSFERDDTAMAFPAVRAYGSAISNEPVRGCPDENVLVLLAEGVLDGADRVALDGHLDTCAACSMLVAELARLTAPTRSAPPRYKVIRQLGAGAMGVVWEAEDTSLHRKVALKFVKPEGADDRGLRKRLLREARALAQVRHPNVMALYDAGEADDEVCLVLELVVGTNARAWRDAAPRATSEILAVWKQAAAGIVAVHKAGIVHRDIKPDNVFVADDGRVLIGDFGLATGDGVDSTTSLTVSGAVIGTPLYMSPEQLQGKTASVMSDQFALCASIWEAVVGERPFRGSTIAAVVLAMAKSPEFPKAVTPEQRRILAILLRGLDPDPTRRFANVAALISALDEIDKPAGGSRASLWIGVGAVVLAVGGTVAVMAATRGNGGNTGDHAWDGSSGSAGSAGSAAGTSGSASSQQVPGSAAPNTGSSSSPTASPNRAGSSDASSGTASPNRAGSSDAFSGTTSPNLAASGSPAPSGSPSKAISKQLPPTTAAPPTRTPGAPTVPAIKPATEPMTIREDMSFTHLMQRASDKLAFGDGAGCLKLLAQIPDIPDDQMEGVDLVKIQCRMATGDCDAAATALRAFGAKHAWGEDRLKTWLEAADTAYCPLEAPPQSRWPARAQYRLTVAAGLGHSCKPVLDAIKKHGIVLPQPKTAAFMEIQCMVNVGDCAGAKAKYRDVLIPAATDPTVRPQIEESIDKAFHTSYKKCPG